MHVHQISLQYRPLDDRILLRISLREGGEQTAWLTRRLLLKLWPLLRNSVADFVAKVQATQGTAASSVALADGNTRQLLSDLRSSAANEKADFSRPYAEAGSSLDNTLLVHTVNLYSQPQKARFAIELVDKPATPDSQARRLKWDMDETTLHASMKLLDDAIQASGWDIRAATASAEPAPASQTDSLHALERPKYLN
ncbi:MAG: hypothetical protein QMB72_07965 [Brachymonas denitrificans]|jgi:hypothetical protein|uniref:hypothetical protein n=1 Tax=Brachymonas denitrificans TaxID=28220 RepID=UPI00352E7D62